jgi:lipopolysaccharide export system permease protein
MLKKLDLYILKKFGGTFFLMIFLFILIAVVFDISEKIDDFEKFTMNEIIFDYYFSFIPWLFNLLTPILAFLTVVYFTGRMASKTEIIPILASGISFKRFLRPYFFGGIALFILSLILSHILIPITNKKRIAIEARIYTHSRRINNTKLHREIAKDHFIYVQNYSNKSDNAYKFRLEKIVDGELLYRFTANNMKWNQQNKKWIARSWAERTIEADKETLIQGNNKDTTFKFGAYVFDKTEFKRSPYEVETMDVFDIFDFIEKEKMRGSSHLGMYQQELVKRTSNPFSIIILVLIAACISSRKVKGGVGMHVAIGIGIALVFTFFQIISEKISVHTPIPAEVALWVPNIIFTFVAIFIYVKAPK